MVGVFQKSRLYLKAKCPRGALSRRHLSQLRKCIQEPESTSSVPICLHGLLRRDLLSTFMFSGSQIDENLSSNQTLWIYSSMMVCLSFDWKNSLHLPGLSDPSYMTGPSFSLLIDCCFSLYQEFSFQFSSLEYFQPNLKKIHAIVCQWKDTFSCTELQTEKCCQTLLHSGNRSKQNNLYSFGPWPLSNPHFPLPFITQFKEKEGASFFCSYLPSDIIAAKSNCDYQKLRNAQYYRCFNYLLFFSRKEISSLV